MDKCKPDAVFLLANPLVKLEGNERVPIAQVDHENELINILPKSEGAPRVKYQIIHGCQPHNLLSVCFETRPTLIHLSCHGETGQLLLEDVGAVEYYPINEFKSECDLYNPPPVNTPDPTDATETEDTPMEGSAVVPASLQPSPHTQLFVFNVCHSEAFGRAVQETLHIPHVLAVKGVIDDTAASEFLRFFYYRLYDGQTSVVDAFTFATRKMRTSSHRKFYGQDDGCFVLLPDTPPGPGSSAGRPLFSHDMNPDITASQRYYLNAQIPSDIPKLPLESSTFMARETRVYSILTQFFSGDGSLKTRKVALYGQAGDGKASAALAFSTYVSERESFLIGNTTVILPPSTSLSNSPAVGADTTYIYDAITKAVDQWSKAPRVPENLILSHPPPSEYYSLIILPHLDSPMFSAIERFEKERSMVAPYTQVLFLATVNTTLTVAWPCLRLDSFTPAERARYIKIKCASKLTVESLCKILKKQPPESTGNDDGLIFDLLQEIFTIEPTNSSALSLSTMATHYNNNRVFKPAGVGSGFMGTMSGQMTGGRNAGMASPPAPTFMMQSSPAFMRSTPMVLPAVKGIPLTIPMKKFVEQFQHEFKIDNDSELAKKDIRHLEQLVAQYPSDSQQDGDLVAFANGVISFCKKNSYYKSKSIAFRTLKDITTYARKLRGERSAVFLYIDFHEPTSRSKESLRTVLKSIPQAMRPNSLEGVLSILTVQPTPEQRRAVQSKHSTCYFTQNGTIYHQSHQEWSKYDDVKTLLANKFKGFTVVAYS